MAIKTFKEVRVLKKEENLGGGIGRERAFQGKGKTGSELKTVGSSVETLAWVCVRHIKGRPRGRKGHHMGVASKALPLHRKSLQTH